MLKRLRLLFRAFYLLLPLQFRVLYQVFLMRVVDLELLTSDSDISQLVSKFASLFLSISVLFSAPFIIFGLPHIPPPISWTFQHFLISTTMVIVGLFSVLTWDSIFPDRRDVLVLAPLPVRPSTIFLAKISALLATTGLVIVSLNAVSGIAFPVMLFSLHLPLHFYTVLVAILRAILAYWITLFAASLFLFSTVVAIQGIAAQLLPRQLFLRLSAFLQVALFCLFLGTFLLEPSLESPRALLARENQHLLRCLPDYWFLGLFNQLNGSMHPAMLPLVHRAWRNLGISVLSAGAIVLLTYFRTMRKIAEQPDIVAAARRFRWTPGFGSPIKTVVILFSLRALLRSRQHRVLLSFYFGVGLAMVLAYVSDPLNRHGVVTTHAPTDIDKAFLIASILLLFLVVIGLRIVSTIPIALRANWIFQVTQTRNLRDYLNAVRFSWLLLGVLPICLITAALLAYVSPWRLVAMHLGILALLGVLLVEACLHAFRKVPFACSYLPGKGNVNVFFWIFVAFFLPMLDRATQHEQQLFTHPRSYAATLFVLVFLVIASRYGTNILIGPYDDLIFEEEEPPIMVSLKLT